MVLYIDLCLSSFGFMKIRKYTINWIWEFVCVDLLFLFTNLTDIFSFRSVYTKPVPTFVKYILHTLTVTVSNNRDPKKFRLI